MEIALSSSDEGYQHIRYLSSGQRGVKQNDVSLSCRVFAADSMCGNHNSSLNSSVKTYPLHVVAWWPILWGLFTFRLLLGDFEMDNPIISSSLICFWRQELRGRGAGTSCLLAKAMCSEEQKKEGDAWAKCWWGEGSRARNKPLPAESLAPGSIPWLSSLPCLAILPACPVPGRSLSGREAVFFVETCSPLNYFSIAKIKTFAMT